MEINLQNLGSLRDAWITLTANVVLNKNFNYNLFKDTFIDTFITVKGLANQESVEKKYMTLLAFLKDFENTRLIGLSEDHKAACHLTHEMIQDCFIRVYALDDIPVMKDSTERKYSYEDVDTLIEIIKNHI